MKVINQTQNTVLATEVSIADTALKRMVGLLGRKDFKDGEALVLKPSNSIHTLFMRFTIDVLFLDKENKVIDAVSLSPWRLSKIYFNATQVIEFPPGTLQKIPTPKGDLIAFESP